MLLYNPQDIYHNPYNTIPIILYIINKKNLNTNLIHPNNNLTNIKLLTINFIHFSMMFMSLLS